MALRLEGGTPAVGQAGADTGQERRALSREQVFTHNLVKTQITVVVGALVIAEKLGLYLSDGVLLSNFASSVACSESLRE